MMIIILISILLGVTVYGKQGFGPTDQEWGYVTIRENAHMFWWLHYTSANVTKYTDRPLIVWLQGGPGSSSTAYGNFHELGPLDENYELRNTSWDKHANILFVDNPVGTGFSYADNNEAFAKTNEQIGTDFVELMRGFYEAIPEMRQVPLYIFSESYGGKMTVDIALALDKAIKSKRLKCKLIGIGLGDSSISPIDSVLSWGPYLKSVGMTDQHGYDLIMGHAKKAEKFLQNGEYINATRENGNAEGAVFEATGALDIYNILTKLTPPSHPTTKKRGNLLERRIYPLEKIMEDVKKALNINQTWGAQTPLVFYALEEDIMKPVVRGVEKLLNDTDIIVAVYNGQYDVIVDIGGTIKWMDRMQWKNKAECQNKMQRYYVVDNFIEGYQKKCGNFQFYTVLRAGHMVPSDNPAGMFYILKTVTNNFDV